MSTLGIAAGLATAGLWTATAVCFESSSRRLGSFPVNVLRLLLACVMFFVLSLIRSGTLLPAGLSVSMWYQLIVSGVTGFVLGDLLLFEAFVLIGARLSMLIYASVPSMSALAAFLCLDEAITVRHVLGMAITLLGIATAILGGTHHAVPIAARNRRRGVVYAIGGSAGQAAGLLFGKSGSVGLDAFAATEVRVIAGLAGFVVFAIATRRIGEVVSVVGRALCPTTTLTTATDQQESAQKRAASGVATDQQESAQKRAASGVATDQQE
ncbi:MAG TPA: DMT family transporter, partial [Polyangiaceae bacterium]|nr:DMT family transporter [Polyangiaceae bacterium]